jgi:hypothetical protein
VGPRGIGGAITFRVGEGSGGLVMVGYGVLVPDAQAPGLAKRFDQMEDGRWQMAEGWWGRFLPPQGGLCSLTAFREAARTPTPSLTSYWNERKAHEIGVVPISSGYTLGFWRSREERCQAQFL